MRHPEGNETIKSIRALYFTTEVYRNKIIIAQEYILVYDYVLYHEFYILISPYFKKRK